MFKSYLAHRLRRTKPHILAIRSGLALARIFHEARCASECTSASMRLLAPTRHSRAKCGLGLSVALLVYTHVCSADTATSKQGGADTTSGPAITIAHTVPSSSDIPPVGSMLRMQVSLRNTIDIETRVRLVGSKDGRFMDIAFPQGALNAQDLPTFSTDIPSPVAAMTYQFIVHQRDGSLTASPKFTLKRACIQNFRVDVPDSGGTADFRREMASLVAKSNRLDRDNKSLDASLKLLEEMKGSLSR